MPEQCVPCYGECPEALCGPHTFPSSVDSELIGELKRTWEARSQVRFGPHRAPFAIVTVKGVCAEDPWQYQPAVQDHTPCRSHLTRNITLEHSLHQPQRHIDSGRNSSGCDIFAIIGIAFLSHDMHLRSLREFIESAHSNVWLPSAIVQAHAGKYARAAALPDRARVPKPPEMTRVSRTVTASIAKPDIAPRQSS